MIFDLNLFYFVVEPHQRHVLQNSKEVFYLIGRRLLENYRRLLTNLLKLQFLKIEKLRRDKILVVEQ